MSYGHMGMQFLDPVEAQRFLDECRANHNRTAENYQDRVNAERCIMAADGWTPTPLPPIDSSTARAAARPKARRSTKKTR